MQNSVESQTSESVPPKEWSQERQDFLVQSALKEAAGKSRQQKAAKK